MARCSSNGTRSPIARITCNTARIRSRGRPRCHQSSAPARGSNGSTTARPRRRAGRTPASSDSTVCCWSRDSPRPHRRFMNVYLKRIPPVASTVFVATVLAATMARAQYPEDNWPVTRDPGSLEPLNRFSLNYRTAFNIRASFRHLGGVPPVSNPGNAAGGQDHTYDDGYVRHDSSIGDGYTWNWGYVNSRQVPGNDTIQFHSHRSESDGRIHDASDDPNHGAELVYNRLLGRSGEGLWGFESALNWANLAIQTPKPHNPSPERP